MPRTKPPRVLDVLSTLTSRLLVVRVTEGKRGDEYTVSSHDGAVWVSHTVDRDRKYRVHCEAGVPTACDCPAGSYGKDCRHRSLAVTLIERGHLNRPSGSPDADDLPTEAEWDERAAGYDWPAELDMDPDPEFPW